MKYTSQETRDKISKARIGMKFSNEHKKNLSLARLARKERLGYLVSQETRKKLSIAGMGRVISEETRQRMSVAQLKSKGCQKERNCITCGTSFLATDYQVDVRKKRFCSQKCKRLSAEGRVRLSKVLMGKTAWNKGIRYTAIAGANNPNWKGGITKLYEKIRKLPENRNWVKSVMKRDNYTCQECDKRGGNLEAHHIIGLSEIISMYKIDTVDKALVCVHLWDTDNGQTLCKDCHKKTDNFGYRGRTLTYPAGTKFVGGTAPTLSTAAGAEDVLAVYYNGSNYKIAASLGFA